MTWTVDRDDWVVRKAKPGDLDYMRTVDPKGSHSFVQNGKAYCRSFGQAEAIDERADIERTEFAVRCGDRHGGVVARKAKAPA